MKKLSILLAFTFVFFLSCEEQKDTTIVEKEITISEVQDYFNSEVDGSESGRKKREVKIQWDQGEYRHTVMGDAIVFPLKYKNKTSVSANENFQGSDLETASFIFVYKNQKRIQLEVVEFIPKTNDPFFTGHITVRDWKGNLKRFFEMDNGEYVTEKAEVVNERGNFVCTTTYYWYCTEQPGGDTCELDHVDVDCVDTSPPAGPMPVEEYLDAGPTKGGGVTPVTCPPGTSKNADGDCIPDSKLAEILACEELSDSQFTKLEGVVEDYISNCYNAQVFEYATENGMRFCFKIGDLNGEPGSFNFNNQSISFKDTQSINTSVFGEEFYHAYQDNFYGGLSQFNSFGRSNIEFEAKLFHDLTHGGTCCIAFGDPDTFEEYWQWIAAASDYFTKMPNWLQLSDKYFYFMEKFTETKPSYNYPIIYSMQPSAMLNLVNCL